MSFDVPIPHAAWETLLMRLLFASVLWRAAMPGRLPALGQPRPVGLARFVDLEPLARPAVYRPLRTIAVVALPLYVAGVGLPLVVPYLCVFCTLMLTLANSQGAANHRLQVLVLVLLVQAVFYVTQAEAAALDWRARFGPGPSADALAMDWSRQAIIAVYLTAGLTKVLRSGIHWVRDGPYIALQVVKSAEQEYHGRLDGSRRARARATAAWILRHPALVRVALTLGLLAELASPLALAGRMAGAAGGLLLVAFHRALSRYMRVEFSELERCVVIYLVNVPYWLVRGVHWLLGG